MSIKNISKYLFFLLIPVIVLYYIVLLLKKRNVIGNSDSLEKDIVDLQNIVNEQEITTNGFNNRQLDIINYLRDNNDGRVSTMLKVFPNVTDRTLRRDFNKLESLGVVKKSGSTKSASYTLVI